MFGNLFFCQPPDPLKGELLTGLVAEIKKIKLKKFPL